MRLPRAWAVIFAGCVCAARSRKLGASISEERRHAENDEVSLVQLSTQPERRDNPKVCVVADDNCFDMDLLGPGGDSHASGSYNYGPEGRTHGDLTVEIVVTRASEDIQWIDAFSDIPTTVYNRKGSDTLLPTPRPNLNVIESENIGREDDSMMRHIVNNYDSLPDVTVFLQGWPFLHCGDVVRTIRRALDSWTTDLATTLGPMAMNGLVPLSRTYYEYNVQKGQLGILRSMVNEDPESSQHAVPSNEEGLPQGYMGRARDLFNEQCVLTTGYNCPSRIWVSEGAQWIVSKERIRSFPKDKYQAALAHGEGYEAKLRGLVLEAMWPIIWGAHAWNPRNTSDPEHGWKPPSPQLKGPSDVHPIRRFFPSGYTFSDDMPNVESAMQAPATDHCVSGVGGEGLLWSCEARMGFCEQHFHNAGPGAAPPSVKFVEQRPRFHVSGGNETWSMVVVIGSPQLAMTPHHINVVDRGVRLTPDAHATAWTVSESQETPGTYLFSTNGRFLSCKGAGGVATTGPDPMAWTLHEEFDGLFSFRSASGVLALEYGAPALARSGEGYHVEQTSGAKRIRAVSGFLRCYPEDALPGIFGEKNFLLDLIEKASNHLVVPPVEAIGYPRFAT